MGSCGRRGSNDGIPWIEEGENENKTTVVYQRRRQERPPKAVCIPQISQCNREARVSFAPPPLRRASWNRSLSTRGRTSITFTTAQDYTLHPGEKAVPKRHNQAKKRSGKQTVPDFTMERAYFDEVDSVELLEESPSPKQFGTWAEGAKECVLVEDLPAILERWRICKVANSGGRSGPLFDIIETPTAGSTPQKLHGTSQSCISLSSSLAGSSVSSKVNKTSVDSKTESIAQALDALNIADNKEHLETPLQPSLTGEYKSSYIQLLKACKQAKPLPLSEVFSKFGDESQIMKIGEGTYGEAFRVGDQICKIVPIDGDVLVNGEIQKQSGEVLEEVLLSLTLNSLRGRDGESCLNACSTFIESKDFWVCKGRYADALISAWEDWDAKNSSENDNPKDFVDNQSYIVFVLADGGKDLEGFVLLNFDEARSLLVQVALGLAVAEVSCEFEHRDLHWGNILLTRKEVQKLEFTLQGRKLHVATFGIVVSVIDFTLSRINTGEAILFLDLSSDPALFEGPKGNKQSEAYRKMREITEDCWEESFPKTNVVWLQYLVDILLLKKSFKRTGSEERELRSFKKRLNEYSSARASLADAFFCSLIA